MRAITKGSYTYDDLCESLHEYFSSVIPGYVPDKNYNDPETFSTFFNIYMEDFKCTINHNFTVGKEAYVEDTEEIRSFTDLDWSNDYEKSSKISASRYRKLRADAINKVENELYFDEINDITFTDESEHAYISQQTIDIYLDMHITTKPLTISGLFNLIEEIYSIKNISEFYIYIKMYEPT